MKTLLLLIVGMVLSFALIGLTMAERDEVGFSLGSYDPDYPLTIYPSYAWHTFYGSEDYDDGNAVVTDGSGNVYVTGVSGSTWNGPTGQTPLHPHSGSYDIFVLKLNSSGAYQWHTFYGSEEGYDVGNAVVTDESGNVYVTGISGSTWKGPIGQTPLHSHSGSADIFVLKLGSSGAYRWHTFYGPSEWDDGKAIATDENGNVYVTGTSLETWNGPALQSPLHAYSGSDDIFVLKLNSSGAYQWHTFYGSGTYDYGNAIATDGNGNVYVTGTSFESWNGPDLENPLHAYSAGDDIFVLKLDSGGAYQWHTFYGSGIYDYGNAIATDGSGNVYVTGTSFESWNGPDLENPLHAYSGSNDIFALKLDSGGAYQWHTFYGSSEWDHGNAIVTDGSGNVYVTGISVSSWNGPDGQSPLHAHTGYSDIFVLKLDSSGPYQWHTFYGSNDLDNGYGIAADGSGNVYVTGTSSESWNGPAGESPLHANSGGYDDIFILKLSHIIAGISLSSPNGGETWATGSAQTIRWTYTGNPGSYVMIELLKGGVVNRVIKSSTSKGRGGNGSFNWIILSTQVGGSDYRIRITDTSNSSYTDTSDNDFTIVGPPLPTISVISPNGGENLAAGITQTIRWSYTGNPGPYVKIELLKGGIVNQIIKSFVSKGNSGSGSYNWKIPANLAPGTDYRIRVTSTKNSTYTGTSDSDFTIAAPTITLVSPNGGEILTAGTTQKISWNYTGNPGARVKIELLKAGVVNRVIASVPKGSGGSGSRNWTIPANLAPGTDYRIRVTSTTNGAYTDTSDSDLTIQ